MSERTDLMEKRILIIDLDGTIIDSRERHISVMQDVLAGIKNNVSGCSRGLLIFPW